MFFSNSHKCFVITFKKGHDHFLLHPSKFIVSSFCTHAKNKLYHPKQTGGAECSTLTLLSLISQFKNVIFSDIPQLFLLVYTIHYVSLVIMTLGTTSPQHIWLGVADNNGSYPLRTKNSLLDRAYVPRATWLVVFMLNKHSFYHIWRECKKHNVKYTADPFPVWLL